MESVLRVLIVEDSEDDALLMVKALEKDGFRVTYKRVKTAEEVEESLAGEKWDVILADYKMPHLSVLETLELIRKKDFFFPFIIVSGTIGEETAVQTVKMGASDYVMKDNLIRLGSSVKREIQEAQIRRERKKMEEEIVFKKTVLEVQSETTIDGILTVDNQGKVILSNENFKKMWDVPPEIMERGEEEIILQWILDNVKDPDGYTEKVKCLREDNSVKCHDEIKLKNGKVFEIYSAPLNGPNGSLYGRTWYFRDITDREETEKVIVKSLVEWTDTFDSIEDMISIHDRDFKILKLNRSFSEKVKIKPHEICGRPCYEVLYGRKEPPLMCPHIKTMETKKTAREEFFNPHLGIYVEETTSPIFDDKGEVTGIVHIVKDISERKEKDFQTRKHLNELEVFYEASVGREERILDLKKEIERLKKELKDRAGG